MRTNSAFGPQKSNSLICRSGEPRYAKARIATTGHEAGSLCGSIPYSGPVSQHGVKPALGKFLRLPHYCLARHNLCHRGAQAASNASRYFRRRDLGL